MMQPDESLLLQNTRPTWTIIRKMAGTVLSLESQEGFEELGQGVVKYLRTFRVVH